MKLENRVAIVTGGSRGIGRAACLALAREGAAVVVNHSNSASDADAVVAAIRGNGGDAIAIQADVSDDAAVRAMVGSTVARFGRLDILVNNAGWTKLTLHRNAQICARSMMTRKSS